MKHSVLMRVMDGPGKSGHPSRRFPIRHPATARRIDLESFGPVNAAVFARLLPP